MTIFRVTDWKLYQKFSPNMNSVKMRKGKIKKKWREYDFYFKL